MVCISAIGAYKRGVSTFKPKLIKLDCYQQMHPLEAITGSEYMPYIVTSHNQAETAAFLKKMGVKAAYVLGWNDHVQLNVIRQDGNVAPYAPFVNVAEWVLFAEDCACPGSEHKPEHGKPCHEEYRAEYPQPRPYVPEYNHVLPVQEFHEEYYPVHHEYVNPPQHHVRHERRRRFPCVESSSSSDSSSSEECEERCRRFPKICKKKCRSRSRCHGRPNKKIEICKSDKTFVFDIHRFRRRGDVLVKVCSKDEKARFEEFIISRHGEVRGKDDRRCVPEHLPPCLRCPKKLFEIKRRIERKVCEKVCLYVNERCEIFVLVGDCKFFRVIVKGERRERDEHHSRRDEHDDRRDERHCRDFGRKFCLKRIREHKLRKLIRHGLFGVEFESSECD